jgi:hypothetical protein
MPIKKGQILNPTGKNGSSRLDQMVIYDLRQAARRNTPEAFQFIVATMRNEDADDRVRLAAAEIILERAYGKPQQQAQIDVQHRFVVAPNTMELEQWLANKGQPTPMLPPPDDDGKPN